MKRISVFAFCAALVGLLLASSGCAGYRLGSMLPDDIKTVYVPSFLNETSEPLIEIDCQRAVIEELQRDGSLQIADEASADSIVRVRLREYRLEPVVFDTTSRSNVRQYRIRLTAAIVMTRRVDDTVIVERPAVRGEGVFTVAGDLSSSKLTGLPVAAADLARNIVQQMVEAW
ncbi:MAG TPA: LptE family protein [Kiritimatiellia bacterium]|nr:LptE family protein [Kiritimatiellia bacterium]